MNERRYTAISHYRQWLLLTSRKLGGLVTNVRLRNISGYLIWRYVTCRQMYTHAEEIFVVAWPICQIAEFNSLQIFPAIGIHLIQY